MFQGSTRRYVLSLVVALLMAAPIVRTAVVIPNACMWLEPGSWLYRMLGCDGEAAGGGGGGAG